MPTFHLQCECGDRHLWYSIHTGPPKKCPTCAAPFVNVIEGVNVIGDRTQKANEKDGVLAHDLDAYKRLRRNGLQPKQIDGAAHLESHADTQFEVEYGKIADTPEVKRKVREGIERAAEMTAT